MTEGEVEEGMGAGAVEAESSSSSITTRKAGEGAAVDKAGATSDG